MPILTVNGRTQKVAAEPETPPPLRSARRTGAHRAKFGCGLGQCGACTVEVEGRAVLSCLTPIGVLEGRPVTTVEGLGSPENPGPLQAAFIAENAAQCGYCIAGMVMRAHALLRSNPHPSDAEIRDGLRLNLCRCGTHIADPRRRAPRRRPDAGHPPASTGATP